MIGQPVMLTVRQDFDRPSSDQIAAFQRIPTGFLVDAQNGTGALDYRIKPLATDMAFAGSVITVHVEPRDMLAVQPGIALAQPGDVVLIETGGYHDAAVIGDNVAIMRKIKGSVPLLPMAWFGMWKAYWRQVFQYFVRACRQTRRILWVQVQLVYRWLSKVYP